MKTHIYSLTFLTVFIVSTTNTMQKPGALNLNGSLNFNSTLNPNGSLQSTLNFAPYAAASQATPSSAPLGSQSVESLQPTQNHQMQEIKRLQEQQSKLKREADRIIDEIQSGGLTPTQVTKKMRLASSLNAQSSKLLEEISRRSEALLNERP